MFKRILVLATLVCALPAMANAWTLNTWAKSAGGSISSRNGVQTTVNGSVFKAYTTHADLTATATPLTGYTISKTTCNGVNAGTDLTPLGLATASCVSNLASITPTTPANFIVTFRPGTVSVTASAATGASVSPRSLNNVYYGQTVYTPIKFVFTPKTGFAIGSISGMTGTMTSATVAGKVTVTIPVGFIFTAPVALSASPTSTSPVANAGAPQTVLTGTPVTLNGSFTGTPAFTNWSSTNFPRVALNGGTTLTPTFTPATPGFYTFKLAVGGASSAFTTVTVTNSTAASMRNACVNCHTATGVGTSANVYTNWSSGQHRANADACTKCHVGADAGAHPGAQDCKTCHNTSTQAAFYDSWHWNNHLESGPEFTGGAVEGQLDANNSYLTKENGTTVTCAYRCHFKPGMGPNQNVGSYLVNGKATGYLTYTDTLNGKTYTRPGGDSCWACHEPHNPVASYQTCLTCHAGGKHGKVPNEFWGSKHWNSNLETGAEFANQIATTVVNGNVQQGSAINGVLNANDSYTTTENGGLVTCAYRCHFRPGMGPNQNVGTVLANGKSTGYITYTDTTGKYGPVGTVYSRPGGDSCMACHDAHGLEASAQSTCYTCHSGSNHGWSVAAFEKSTHFTGDAAKAEGMSKEACVACHNAHSTEAEFANLSTASTLHTAGMATGCQKCHTPGVMVGPPGAQFSISIFNADGTGKAPHFQTNAPGADGYYPTGSYDGGGSTCIDCHYHNNSINAGWAKGGHASTTSVPLVTSAADNWNRGTKRGAVSNGRTYTGDYTINAQVSDCQRCHTAKGFTLFYDSGFKNVSTVREGIKTSGPITCDACHVPKTAGTKLYNGKVRPLATGLTNVKTYVGNAKYLTNASDAVTTSMSFPANYANSNVCIPCHAGRGTGDLVKASFAAGTVLGNDGSPDNLRDILSIGTAVYAHFAAVAGVVNGSSAYTFSSFDSYSSAQKHKRIGTLQNGAAYGTTSTMGPCVGCHMTSSEGHSLEAVTYDAGKKINGFSTPVCTNCHGAGFTPAIVQAKKEEFEAALNLLRNLLLNKGFDGLQAEIAARPGERVKMNMALGYNAYAAAGGTLSIKDFAERNTGAAFNWWLFGKTATVGLGDPAAYVHNPTYVRQVIKESIDWMDDFTMNNSTAAAIDAQVGAPVKYYSGVADGVPVDATAAAKAKAYLGL